MKIFTVIAVVCYLFVATNSVPAPLSPPGSDVTAKCSKNYDVPSVYARDLLSHSVMARKENEKCFLSCYLKGMGYYADGKIDFDKILEDHKGFLPVNVYHDLEKGFKECPAKMDYNKNECEVAYDAFQCGFSKTH